MLDPFGQEAAVARNVKAARKYHGVSQKQLSERMAEIGRPMSVATISVLEAGRRRVTVDDLAALGRAFGVHAEALLLEPFLGARPEELREYMVLLKDGDSRQVTASSVDVRDGWLWLSTRRGIVFSAPESAVACVRAVDE